jgi:ribosomal protein L34
VKLLPVKLGAALRQGFRVRVTGATGRVTLKARRGRTVVAKGTACARGGRAVVRMRFTKSARRSLRKARKVTLRVSGAGKTATITIAR